MAITIKLACLVVQYHNPPICSISSLSIYHSQFCHEPSTLWAIFRPIFQSALRGGKLNLLIFLLGASATKSFEGQEFSGMGKIF